MKKLISIILSAVVLCSAALSASAVNDNSNAYYNLLNAVEQTESSLSKSTEPGEYTSIDSESLDKVYSDIISQFPEENQANCKAPKKSGDAAYDNRVALVQKLQSGGPKSLSVNNDSAKSTVSIMYSTDSKEADNIIFMCTTTSTTSAGTFEFGTVIKLNYKTGYVTDFTVTSKAPNTLYNFTGEAGYYASSIGKESDISYSITSYFNDASLNASLNQLCNFCRKLTFTGVESILMRDFGMNMADIGFTQFGSPTSVSPTGISLNKTSVTLNEGESTTLTATISPDNASDKSVTWTSSNTNVATVWGGTVSAKSAGTTTITTTTSNGKTASCSVTVKEQYVYPTGISLNQTSLSLKVGGTGYLSATITPSNASDKSVTWSSSNSGVAKVSNGTVTAVSAGSATITARTSNGKVASCTVTVKSNYVYPTEIYLNKTSISLNVGETSYLSATVTPSNANDKTVTWSSSNIGVATVSNGTVTAKSAGTATITAKTSNNKTATCTVTVKSAPTSISLNKTTASMSIGDNETLIATVSPSDAYDKSVTWTSDNNSVATVYKGTVTAHSNGTATITATTSNGITASCKIIVAISPTQISLDKTSATLNVGDKLTLTATVYPDDAGDKSVIWTTSDDKIASVSDGNVKTKSAGTAVITATTSNGLTATCTVTVTLNPTNIELSSNSETLKIGETTTLTARITPHMASDVSVNWTSSDETVITVNNGTITAHSAGAATVIAATSNGLTAVCTVRVISDPTKIELDRKSVSLNVGETVTLKANILPEDASDKTIIWTTSDESIITVDNGVISAHSEGAATIIAKTSNGLIDVCTITVNAPKDTDSDTSSDNKTNTDTTDTADTPGIPETKDTPSKPDNPETPDTPDKPVKEIMLGDVDGDGKVTAKDSMAIQRYTVNLTKFDDNQLLAADTNGDHKVTSKDAMNILRYTVKLNTKYPIGENV